MPHQTVTRHFDRNKGARQAVVRSLARGLILYEQITTTVPKAKEAQRLTEHLISLGKKGSLSARRMAMGLLADSGVVHRLFTDVAPRFSNRAAGYTRILHTGTRAGDGASLAVLELVERPAKEKVKLKARAESSDRGKARERPLPLSPEERPPRKREPQVEAPSKPKEPPSRKEKEPRGDKRLPRPRGFLEGLRKIFKKDRHKP